MNRVTGKRAFSTYGGRIETSGDPGAAIRVAGAFRHDAALDRVLTHGFHSYAGRMPPSVARRAIATWSKAGDRILDPFCGSGTVLVEAFAAGRAAVGVDLSPLAVRLARVRSAVLTADDRVRLAELAKRISKEALSRARSGVRPQVPQWGRAEFERFDAHVALELFTLRSLVYEVPEDPVGLALRLTLSSILVKLLRESDEGGENPPRRFGRGFASKHFHDRTSELLLGLEDLAKAVPAGTESPLVLEGDATSLPMETGKGFPLVLTSPPYPGVYDYEQHHDVRFRWLDLGRRKLRGRQIGVRLEAAGGAASSYIDDRRRWMGEIASRLHPGGHAVFLVGDGVIAGRPEDGLRALIDEGRAQGLVWLAAASQARAPLDRRVSRLFRGHERREHLVLFRAPASR